MLNNKHFNEKYKGDELESKLKKNKLEYEVIKKLLLKQKNKEMEDMLKKFNN
jgi:hypothetical protein